MSASMNRVTLIGRLGADPEVRYLREGQAAATLSLATTETWKDRNTGERREQTDWHRVALWGSVAEVAGKHCHKGDLVLVEGRLRTRKWQGQDGQDRYTTEVVVGEHAGLKFLGQPGGGRGAATAPAGGGGGAAEPAAGESVPFDDDIPF